MTEYDTARPHLACFVILRRQDTVAFVLRTGTSWMNGFYGLPAGKVEKDEPVAAGAVREAQEEIGVTIKLGDLRHVLTEHRRNDDMTWIDIYFEASTWEGEPYNAEPHMHGELAWLDTNNLPDNVVPAVRHALEQIAKGISYAEYGWETSAEAGNS